MRKITGVFPTIIFYIVFLFVSIRYDCTIYPLIALSYCLPHELGHIAAIYICGLKLRRIDLSPAGAVIRLDTPPKSGTHSAFISLAGAAANLLCFFLLLPFSGEPVIANIAAGELVCGAFNLLPIKPLDGWCALDCLAGSNIARQLLSILSGICLGGLFCASAYLVMFVTVNFSPLIVCFCLFSAAYLSGVQL